MLCDICSISLVISTVQRMLGEDELRDALLLVFANKQVSWMSLVRCQRGKTDREMFWFIGFA
jgi:hypothetical protein